MADVITKIGIKDATGTGFDSRDIGAKGQNIEIGYDNNDKIILDVDTTTPVSTKTLTSVLQTDDTLIANLNTSKAPNKHNWTASESVDYGKADATHFGHIRPGTGLYVDSDASSATYGSTNVSFASNKEVAANKAVQGNDSRLSDARKNPNAITFNSTGGAALGTTYDGSAARTIDYSTVGAAPISHTSIQGGESTLGHVKAGTGLSASSGVLSVKYGTVSGTACAGNDSRLSDSRAPKSHASATAITYGAGTDEQYGHVMLSDTYSVETPSKDDSGAAVSLGASAYALQTAYNSLSSSVSSLNSNLGTLQSDVSSLNSNLSSLQTQCDSGTVNDAKTLNGWKYVDVSHPQALHIVNVGDNKELNYSTPTEILTLAEKNQNWTGTWQNKTLDISTVAPNGNWILIDSNNKIQHTTWAAVQSYQCGANINPNGISVRGGWMDFYNGNSMRGSFFCNAGDEMFLRGQNRLTFVTNEAKDNCNFYFSGTGKYTGNWVQTSAKKYKENIQSITEEEAQALLKIEPVSFDYKENGIHTYGFIADDVDELIPDSPYVIHDDGGEPDAIPYTAFVAPMLKLIQMQEKRITELQTKVKSLEANIMQ